MSRRSAVSVAPQVTSLPGGTDVDGLPSAAMADPEGNETAPGDLAADARKLDSRALQGLAHPLRMRMFDQLTFHGPATATQLGERLGESSGSTSYHLRQLAKFGFVEEDADRGTQRERWWRRVPGAIQWRSIDHLDDAAGKAAVDLVDSEFADLARQRRQEFWRNAEHWPDRWTEAVTVSTAHLVLTADEAQKLSAELRSVLDRWKRRVAQRDLVPTTDRDASLVDCDAEVALLPVPSPTRDNPSGIPPA